MRVRETVPAQPPVAGLQQIDAACDRFEAVWREGRVPDLASYLAEAPAELRFLLFRDLLRLDVEFRRERGEQPDALFYTSRFPDFQRELASAFDSQAKNLEETSLSERSDPEQDGTVVHSPPALVSQGIDQHGFQFESSRGPREAGYEILAELGRGGMGVVLKAHQVALNRTVALKLVKSGRFATETEVFRFQNEAEAVAQLDHPHIVPIYEVGRWGDQHFFTMKLVSGTSLDKRLEEFAADPRAAARIVATIAEAVHHAHERGILHRDLKPANILLDDDGQPHVTDFGLAKRLDAVHESTHSGALVGTPSYMSPEQASGTRTALSTATDVYGLGTILYALLAGKAPFAGTTLVDTLDMVRMQAPESPTSINPNVPRDLEVICLKCLEKEPRRRYSSARELAEDMKRWLGGLPIEARPVGRLTRGLMWCRRNRALAGLAALLLLALVGGLAGITWKWREADRERTKAEAVNELLTERLLGQASAEMDPLAKNLTVRELLDRTAAQLGGWLEGQRDVEAKVRETIGGAYLSLGQYDKAEPHIQAAIRLDTDLYGPGHADTVRASNLMASLLDHRGQGAQAEPLARANLETASRSLGPRDPITLAAAERLGTILWHLGKTDEAEALLRKNVDDRSRVLTSEHPDTLRSVYLLSRGLRDLRSFPDAENLAFSYAHSIQCARGANTPDYIIALTNQADVFRDKGDRVQAERFYAQAAIEARNILGADHPTRVTALENHARAVRELGSEKKVP
jgi:tetratricopeptide (TPR) repeat protein